MLTTSVTIALVLVGIATVLTLLRLAFGPTIAAPIASRLGDVDLAYR